MTSLSVNDIAQKSSLGYRNGNQGCLMLSRKYWVHVCRNIQLFPILRLRSSRIRHLVITVVVVYERPEYIFLLSPESSADSEVLLKESFQLLYDGLLLLRPSASAEAAHRGHYPVRRSLSLPRGKRSRGTCASPSPSASPRR